MIVAPAGQYPEGLQGFGHVPGVRGGAIGTGAKIVSRLTYRGTRYLARKFFKPKAYTYRGATARGIAVGTAITALLPSPEIDPLDAPVQPPIRETSNRFQQGNRRRGSVYRARCNNYRHRPRNCCK